jgi:hypothetical protein
LKDDYEEFDQCKDEIFKAKTNSDSLKAFERLKNAINNVREKLGHSDDEWVYETDYM